MNQFIRFLPQTLLLVNGVIYFAIGVVFCLDAERWFGNIGVTLVDPVGYTELRAVYGGMMLALGIFLVLCARIRDWVIPGTAFLLISYLGLVLARSQGMFLLGQSSPMIVQLYVIEWVSLVLSALAMRIALNARA